MLMYASNPFFNISKHSPYFMIYSITFLIFIYILRAIYTSIFLNILKRQNEKQYYEMKVDDIK